MAGRGPSRKQQNQRGESNYTRLERLSAPILPSLTELIGPAPTESGKWPRLTQLLWNAWRESPVTATWSPEDVALAADTICIHAVDPVVRASEIRIRIDDLALSPKGRRSACLLLPEDEEPDEEMPAPTELRALPEAR